MVGVAALEGNSPLFVDTAILVSEPSFSTCESDMSIALSVGEIATAIHILNSVGLVVAQLAEVSHNFVPSSL